MKEGKSSGNEVAPAGMVWCCTACGKRSRDRYGNQRIDRGYDVACVLNAVLVSEADALRMQRSRATGSRSELESVDL